MVIFVREIPLDWLLEGEPWIEYRARVDLLGQTEDDPRVQTARNAMLVGDPVQALLYDFASWPGKAITSHKAAGLLLHKLTFLADLGLRHDDPGMQPIIDHLLMHRSTEGPYQVLVNIPTHFGGMGEDQWAWLLCDTPLITYSLVQFGLGNKPEVQSAIQHLMALVRQNGWPCSASSELGKFRGPGSKDDPCPFANLAMLKLLSVVPEWRGSPPAKAGAETLLTLWNDSFSRHPYLFKMGTDFRKLKAPFVWYDLLHVLDVLTRFSWLHGDPRLLDMVTLLLSKADPRGRFTPESIWTAWKDAHASSWDFAQKKTPSRWLTLLAWRILRRVPG